MVFVNLESGIFEITQVNSKCHRLLSTRAPQSVDFEASSGGDEDNAVRELECPGVIRCSPTFFIWILWSCNGIICSFVDYEKLVKWQNPVFVIVIISLLDMVMILLLMIINLWFLAALLLMVLNKLWLKFLHLEKLLISVMPLPLERLIEGYFVMGLCIGWGCKKLGLTKDKFKEIVPLPDHFDTVVWGIFEKIIQAPDWQAYWVVGVVIYIGESPGHHTQWVVD